VIEIFRDIEQTSPEWDEIRRGIVTASELATVMASGRKKGEPSITRARYLRRLAAERCGAAPGESYSNAHMERGQVMEAEARRVYSLLTDEEPELIGFVRNGETGCSPDALIRADGLLEIKTKLPHLQVEVLEGGIVPSEHVAQVQGQLWICEREFVDFVSYWPGLPPFIKRVGRDEPYIKALAEEVDRFNEELALLVERVRSFGGSPFATVRKQLEAAVNLLSAG
jgi:hypothetical protein